jgi:hypothetical protein
MTQVERRIKKTGIIVETEYILSNEQVEKLSQVPGVFAQADGLLFVNTEKLEQAIRDAGMSIRDIAEEEPVALPRPARRSRK